MNVLVLAAHPDDEVLGCGGVMARLAEEGHAVHIAILGEGITSRYQQRDQADRGLIDALHDRSRQVARLLGAREPEFFDLPDNRFDTVPLLDVVKIIEGLVERLQPAVIYTHYTGDLNLDHVVVARASLIATRPAGGFIVPELYAYEVSSSTEWAFGQFQPYVPNVFVDVHQTLESKIQAMRLYESEARPFPHPRSSEALRSCALRWGSTAGLKAAEAFVALRLIR